MDANGNGPPHLGAVIPLVLIFVAIYSPGAGVSFTPSFQDPLDLYSL